MAPLHFVKSLSFLQNGSWQVLEKKKHDGRILICHSAAAPCSNQHPPFVGEVVKPRKDRSGSPIWTRFRSLHAAGAFSFDTARFVSSPMQFRNPGLKKNLARRLPSTSSGEPITRKRQNPVLCFSSSVFSWIFSSSVWACSVWDNAPSSITSLIFAVILWIVWRWASEVAMWHYVMNQYTMKIQDM